MDEFEGGILSSIPPSIVELTLTRSTIRMQHSKIWRIEKENPVDDLLIGLEGHVEYSINGERLRLSPGEALLIPRNTLSHWMERMRTRPSSASPNISRLKSTDATTCLSRCISNARYRCHAGQCSNHWCATIGKVHRPVPSACRSITCSCIS